jgi:hypothetical protein
MTCLIQGTGRLQKCLVCRACAPPRCVWCTGDWSFSRSGLQDPVLLLDVSDIQETVLLLDLCGLQKFELLQDLSALKEPQLLHSLSGLQGLVLPHDMSGYGWSIGSCLH